MTEIKSSPNRTSPIVNASLWLAGGMIFLGTILVVVFTSQLPFSGTLTQSLKWLFAIDSVQTMWYITRAAGLTSYFLLWLSVALGLAVSSKIFDVILHRSFTYDFHEFLSLAALGFIALHIGVLFFDRYMPYSFAMVFIPFLSSYRPIWIGIGIIAMYLSLLVTVTFYLKSKIGMKAFRAIHVFSLVAYLGVTLHGLFAGTDSSLISVLGLYAGTFLIVVFLSAYWIFLVVQKNHQKRVTVQAARQVGQVQRLVR